MADFWAMVWVTIFSGMTQRKSAAIQGAEWLMGVMGYGLCINEDIKIVKNGSQQR
jgi:ABC-type nickel/cobalt efflux system permease component RcnA